MADSSPESDEIEYLKMIEKVLLHSWQTTRDPDTKKEIEVIAMEIRLQRDLE